MPHVFNATMATIAPTVATVRPPQDCSRLQVVDFTSVEVVDVSRIPILGTSSIIIDEPAKAKVSELQPNFNDVKFEDIAMTDDMINIVSKRKPDMSRLNSVMGMATVDITTDKIRIIANKLGLKDYVNKKK